MRDHIFVVFNHFSKSSISHPLCLQTWPTKCCSPCSRVKCWWRCTAWVWRPISSRCSTASTASWCVEGSPRPFWWSWKSCLLLASLCSAASACWGSSRSHGEAAVLLRVCVCVVYSHFPWLPRVSLQSLAVSKQPGGVSAQLYEVHRFAASAALPLHHHLLPAGHAGVWWEV